MKLIILDLLSGCEPVYITTKKKITLELIKSCIDTHYPKKMFKVEFEEGEQETRLMFNDVEIACEVHSVETAETWLYTREERCKIRDLEVV